MSGQDDDDLDAAEVQAASMTLKSKLLFAAVIVGVLAIAFGPRIVRVWQEEAVAESGVSAPGVIKAVEQTGNISNEVHELRITIEVEPANAAAFEAETRRFVKPHQVPQVQPGSEVTVKYDPQKPQRIAIVEPKIE